jgi:hypothetical protein
MNQILACTGSYAMKRERGVEDRYVVDAAQSPWPRLRLLTDETLTMKSRPFWRSGTGAS